MSTKSWFGKYGEEVKLDVVLATQVEQTTALATATDALVAMQSAFSEQAEMVNKLVDKVARLEQENYYLKSKVTDVHEDMELVLKRQADANKEAFLMRESLKELIKEAPKSTATNAVTNEELKFPKPLKTTDAKYAKVLKQEKTLKKRKPIKCLVTGKKGNTYITYPHVVYVDGKKLGVFASYTTSSIVLKKYYGVDVKVDEIKQSLKEVKTMNKKPNSYKIVVAPATKSEIEKAVHEKYFTVEKYM